jgi:hypothetical protein
VDNPTNGGRYPLFMAVSKVDKLQELVSAELTAGEEAVGCIECEATIQCSASHCCEVFRPSIGSCESNEKLDTTLCGAYWCRFTQAQKERFGKEAFAKIQYVECSPDGLNSASGVCRNKRIEGYPTWEVNGKMYPGDQELEELATIVTYNLKGN